MNNSQPINTSGVITRFAPSPTGSLHVGSARTALFNYLFTKKHGGKMILRIEDTDKERSKKEYEENIIDGLKWLGIEYSEIYRQSERGEIYKSYLKKMIDSGSAYISKEEPKKDGDRTEVIRFKNPNTKIKFNDLIHGEIEFDTTDLGDFVIAKDMDSPLYHLAVVVDDFEMGITHIIRGDDGISNTPRQILIQEAINAPRPTYAHIPLILASDKSKLSKRHGATSISEYKEAGYLSEAMINFLATIGWSPQSEGVNEEIFSLEELTKLFSIEKVQKSGAIFNQEKLNWINKEYLKKLSTQEIMDEVVKFLPNKDKGVIEKIIPIIIDHIDKWSDLKKLISDGELEYFFSMPVYEPEKLNWKEERGKNTVEYLNEVIKLLSDIEDGNFSKEKIKEKIWEYAGEKGRGNVLWPMRVALSGKDKSPDPFLLSEILGKKESINRLNSAVDKLTDRL